MNDHVIPNTVRYWRPGIRCRLLGLVLFFALILPARPQTAPAKPVAATNLPPAALVAVQIQSAGFQLASSNQTVAWFGDPRRLARKIVFIDARNAEEYEAGHIPGAALFDPYHPETYFPVVVPLCQAAELVVVYCHGADCDDSLTAAALLRDVGISGSKIRVYAGGMAEWLATGLPVEREAKAAGPPPATGP